MHFVSDIPGWFVPLASIPTARPFAGALGHTEARAQPLHSQVSFDHKRRPPFIRAESHNGLHSTAFLIL